jgi:hypothetical protein
MLLSDAILSSSSAMPAAEYRETGKPCQWVFKIMDGLRPRRTDFFVYFFLQPVIGGEEKCRCLFGILQSGAADNGA